MATDDKLLVTQADSSATNLRNMDVFIHTNSGTVITTPKSAVVTPDGVDAIGQSIAGQSLDAGGAGLVGWSSQQVKALKDLIALQPALVNGALPTTSGQNTSGSGSVTPGQPAVFSCNGLGTVAFKVTGTWVGNIVVEVSLDGTNYDSTSYVSLATGGTSNSFSANTSGQINVAGFNYVRLRSSTISSGSASVVFSGSALISNVMLDNPLPAGSNNIGNINNITGAVTLPTGAATETTLGQVNTKLPTSLVNSALSTNISSFSFVSSTSNITSTQLAAGAIFTGVIENAFNQQGIQIMATADQPYTVYIDQFQDAAGTVALGTSSFTRLAGQATNETLQVNGNFIRVRLTNNGSATTTTLKLDVSYGPLNPFPTQLSNNGNFKTSLQEDNIGLITAINNLNANIARTNIALAIALNIPQIIDNTQTL